MPRAIIALVVVGVAISIVSISVGTGGPQAVAIDGRAETQALIAGIQQDGARLGSEEAEVVMDVFADLRSPGSAAFQREVVEPIIESEVRDNTHVQINLRHFSFGRSGVTEAAIAATAAGEQGHQWQFADLVLRNLDDVGQGLVDEVFLDEIAQVTPGLEKEEWAAEFEEELAAQRGDLGYESAVDRDGELAFEMELPAEPAVVVTGVGGVEELTGTPSFEDVQAAIDRVGVASADLAP
ncbi:MAG: thioredoxin domain-containing protein [Solirubrobacterales bacterium]